MSRIAVTDFSKRTGSPFQSRTSPDADERTQVNEVVFEKVYEKQKEKQNELQQRVNKKTAEINANKPSDGCFTEVVTHGAFTSKTTANSNNKSPIKIAATKPATNGVNGTKSLLGFPSSANNLALDAKTDLESDPNISPEVKDKVIEKLFALASIAQHIYESKVRLITEFEKFKDVHLKNEARREKEHSEQLYKLNINYQSEVVQAIQQLRSELDISRNVAQQVNEKNGPVKADSMEFNSCDDTQEAHDKGNSDPVVSESDSCDLEL